MKNRANRECNVQPIIANAEIDAGKGVLHGRVVDWLITLGSGEKVPPPLA